LKTILVTNRKGGVGKTTTSLNLAVNLSLKGHKVLLIDLDTQGHLQIGLGIKNNFDIGIHDMLKMDSFYKVGLHSTPCENLDFIPAHINFDISELVQQSYKLKRVLSKIVEFKTYDFCIIDTPPTSDTLLKNALKVSDYALIPMQCEHLSLVGVLQFLRIFYRHSIGIRSKTELLGVVPTMYNRSMIQHREIIKELENELGYDKILPSIRKDIKLSKSFTDGSPISISRPNSRGAIDYENLTQHILKNI
jgi:chromosome partitioning protein